MELTCLSIPNPVSYLVCYGIKDVENRTWSTEYRGRLYVHSGGHVSFRGMPDMSRYPVPLIHEFDALMNQIDEIESQTSYVGIVDNGISVYLKKENRQTDNIVAQYNLLQDVYTHYRSDKQGAFFHANAIIGSVELVDVVAESTSEWAEQGRFQWVFRDPRILREPISRVREQPGLFTYEAPGA
ncbi:MAG: hypothetical protein GVY29_10555 [Spirochaetes bacterium]|jgi:hypothetical protein|nr:hypothetical protein [Spirochaetota bacterium]